MRWVGHMQGEMKNVYKFLVGKPEGKTPLRRCGFRWEDNIEMDVGEVGF
jgi:hypothetical protein